MSLSGTPTIQLISRCIRFVARTFAECFDAALDVLDGVARGPANYFRWLRTQ